jgi:hypothetical protein
VARPKRGLAIDVVFVPEKTPNHPMKRKILKWSLLPIDSDDRGKLVVLTHEGSRHDFGLNRREIREIRKKLFEERDSDDNVNLDLAMRIANLYRGDNEQLLTKILRNEAAGRQKKSAVCKCAAPTRRVSEGPRLRVGLVQRN